jgi:hypothetical protein
MATTTPNYGWTVPTSTDLVKDGATAIETLGDAIDASMNTALGTKKAGMVLLNTTSFSGVSSFSLAADTFTNTYDNYHIQIVCTASTDTTISWRGRTAGSDLSTANYNQQIMAAAGSSMFPNRATGQTLGRLGQVADDTGENVISFDIFAPKQSLNTRVLSSNFCSQDGGILEFNGNTYGLNNSFDSMSVLVSSGNITGTYYVYGYNK